MLRLVDMPRVGERVHRGGWPYALECLKPLLHQQSSVIFDDFVERTFLYTRRPSIRYRSPWVGIFHHPPDIPPWYMAGRLNWARLFANEQWQKSLPFLCLAFTLSDHLTSWLRPRLSVPCVTLKHPSILNVAKWNFDRFMANPAKQLVQVGSFLRNTRAIDYVDCPPLLRKVRLLQHFPWINGVDAECETHMSQPLGRKLSGCVATVATLEDNAYDEMLSKNIVFLEVLASAANNTVIECIARNTPIVVNRHAGTEFYLGSRYPLFYDDFHQIPQLLSIDRIVAAHEYLAACEKSWLDGNSFCNNVRGACQKYVPEISVS